MVTVRLGVGDVLVTRSEISLRDPMEGSILRLPVGTSIVITGIRGDQEFDIAWADETSMLEVPSLPADALVAAECVKFWDAKSQLHWADLPSQP